ncbi:MAG TPA: PQQ-binding-like beta-propeller repeat protein, partial [Candidatus Acidoferrales bacterium]|nr:PQQ-binding-like beta-propeller repeat protein [Candidatus Acidoferrales bacterium]
MNLRLGAAVVAVALCACSQASDSSTPPLPSSGNDAASASRKDDWTTFGHDYERSGLQPLNVGLTAGNVARLKLRWKAKVSDTVYASPLAFNGNLIVVTLGEGHNGAIVYDFRSSDGRLLWHRKLAAGVRATPSIDPGTAELFVSDRVPSPGPSHAYAIRLLDGSLAWQANVPGITHASPVVANGHVYFGVSGGDPPHCVNGGVVSFNERTGASEWRWMVNAKKRGGGSV